MLLTLHLLPGHQAAWEGWGLHPGWVLVQVSAAQTQPCPVQSVLCCGWCQQGHGLLVCAELLSCCAASTASFALSGGGFHTCLSLCLFYSSVLLRLPHRCTIVNASGCGLGAGASAEGSELSVGVCGALPAPSIARQQGFPLSCSPALWQC